MTTLKRAAVLGAAILFLQTPARLTSDQATKFSPALSVALAGASDPDAPLKVWVSFRDKGIRALGPALRTRLAIAAQTMRARCAWRRAKVRSASPLTDVEDLELFTPYTTQVQSLVGQVRAVSRWLNAISVEATPAQIQAVAGLDFVTAIDIVRGFKRDDDFVQDDASVQAGAVMQPATAASASPIYGPADGQLEQIAVPALHQQGLSGRGVLVGMLDVGFRTRHEVFRLAHLTAQWDFVFKDGDVSQNTADPNDYSDSHGTATWSLLGGFKFGEMVGPAFGADFILGKTEDDRSETPVEEDYWVAGLEWMESAGVEVVSSSLGYTDWYTFNDMNGRTAVTTKAADRAASLGVVVVNAAGNERGNAWGHVIAPADGFNVIAVGAVDSTGKISSFSSPGPTADGRIKPEVCAWGVNNWIAAIKRDGSDTYTKGSGTSYATPLTAGVVALLLEAHRDWTPAQVRAALLNTAGNAASPNNDYGWGIVNAGAAVNYKK